jgi:thioredoxin-like negative regulator of GroEL
MFLAPRGEASMAQAIDFADAWASHPGPAFGYVDAFDDVALSRFFEIRVLPTMLVLRDGEEVVRLEGRWPASSIARALAAAGACRSRSEAARGSGARVSSFTAQGVEQRP